jgi:uncharacterized protein involved in exopolysaccharide biosynthesis
MENTPLSASASSARIFMEALFRQQRLFMRLAGMILLLVFVVTLTTKKQYRSEMKFLVENTRSNATITPDRSTSPAATELTEEQINSELEVLQSQDVALAVADPEWASLPVAERTPAAIKAHELKLTSFVKHLKIEPVRKSNVITVSYLAATPREATDTLERLSNAYLTHRRQISRPSGTSSFFTEEASRYQDAWQKANAELVAFQQENHLVSVPDLEESLSKQISSDEDDLRSNESSLKESARRQSESAKALAGLPERQSTAKRTMSNQYSIEQMRTLLVQLDNRRTELLTRYKPTDRLVEEVDHEIADTTAALNISLSERGSEDTTDVNPAWQSVKGTLVEEKVAGAALESKSQSLRHDLGDLRARLSLLQGLAVRFNGLQEQSDQARSNFELFSEKRDQAQIEDAMDERKLVNIAVAESPTSSYHAAAPKPLLNAVLGTLTALFLAGFAVYFAESSRTTIATARELEAASRYPVLATIPYDQQLQESARADASSEGVHPRRRARLPVTLTLSPSLQRLRKVNEQ